MICKVVTPPSSDGCGKPASKVVIFKDGDKVAACLECSINLQRLAESHGTMVKVEPLT